MSTYKSADAQKALLRKGFQPKGGSHQSLVLKDEEGKLTKVSTGFSRGGHGSDLSPAMLSKIARELCMEKKELMDTLECKHDHVWILNNWRNSLKDQMRMQNPTRHRE